MKDKTFSIKTLGCKLNQYDSSLIATQFSKNGWIARPFGTWVDLVIINTCTVTNRSDKKCRNYIRQGAGFSRSGKVLVTGCLVDRNPDDLKKMPEVYKLFKNAEKDKIFDHIDSSLKQIDFSINSDAAPISTINQLEEIRKNSCDDKEINVEVPFSRTRGFIKIQDGCDGECSYCIVPSVRGNPRSRDFHEILEQARKLIDAGCPELILTGVTIGKYDYENRDLSYLIEELVKLSGKFRVRVTSIEPNHITDGLVALLGNEKVCAHLHIPLQSGSDRILQMMKRPYSVNDFMNTVENVKNRNKEIAIGTDIIIGFPEEDENDFKSSLKLIEEAGFSYVHQFSFSSRPGTPAYDIKQNSNSKEIVERSKRLKELSLNVGLKYRESFTGRILPSVIEMNKSRDKYTAVSENYIKMLLKESTFNQTRVGKISDVKLLMTDRDNNVGLLSL